MEQNEIVLTISVPTYNGAKTIRNMLDVLLPQVHETVEILVSDNCSTDETQQIIEDYQKECNFIRYIRNERNIGADGNFLQCAKLAKGKFVMLISDDDIICEGAVDRILEYLNRYPEVTLAYMDTVAFQDKYTGIENTHRYSEFLEPLTDDILTQDKSVFIKYCMRFWGFTSCFIWNKAEFDKIENPEQFFGSYFLQAYISILCSKEKDAYVGCIKGPCIAVGEYGILGNYDVAQVEGLSYHKMIDYAVNVACYDRKYFEKYYIWKICLLGRNNLIKQRAVGVHKTKVSNLIKATICYPYAWLHLYPFLLVPPFVCKVALNAKRRMQGRKFTTFVNRPTE